MKCPVCVTAELVMSDRQGVEIDYCPTCRGVWLDRGELDKIIERATAGGAPRPADPREQVRRQLEPPAPPREEPRRAPSGYQRDPDSDGPHHGHGAPHGHPHARRRKSWLGELFDFD